MARNKPLTQTEKRILAHKKMQGGLSSFQAWTEINAEVKQCIENSKKDKEHDKKITLKEEYEKLKCKTKK